MNASARPRARPTAQQQQIHARQVARRRVMQALYGWQLTQDAPQNILAAFREDEDHVSADDAYFRDLLLAVTTHHSALDARMAPVLDRPVAQLDPIEHAVLWVGIWELTEKREVPCRVIIHEAVAIAKKFGADQSHRFINGVMDRLARELRPDDISLSH